jgi:Fic family protein
MVAVPGVRKLSFEGYQTFVPDPLPPELGFTPRIDKKIEEAVHLLGRVEASRDLLPNADLLIYGSLQREALASSTIEGTIASPDELVLFQLSRSSPREAVREVANYRDALEWGYQEIKTRLITTSLILELHAILMSNVRGASHAGRFKDRQNAIGTHERQRIEDAIFVPPPPQDTLALMTDLERYLNADNTQPKVVQCALAHYQFETIYPFRDGNGRVGRLLIVLQMISLGLLSAPLIYPSVYFEKNRADYYDALQGVRDRGDWSRWVEYFVDGVQAQCEETIELTQTILKLQKRLHREVAHVRRRHSIDAVLGAFFESPVLTAKSISERANMSLGAARSALDDLQEMEIVEEITGKRRDRVYSCEPLFDVIFGRD